MTEETCFVCGENVTHFIDGCNGETIYLCDVHADQIGGAKNEEADINLLEGLDLEIGEYDRDTIEEINELESDIELSESYLKEKLEKLKELKEQLKK
jgi:hypothetical protein